jgi:hypothetical protein
MIKSLKGESHAKSLSISERSLTTLELAIRVPRKERVGVAAQTHAFNATIT